MPPSANSEASLLQPEPQLRSPASPRPAPRPRPAMPTVSAFASALFDEDGNANLAENVSLPRLPEMSSTSPTTGAVPRISESSHAFALEPTYTPGTEPSSSRWSGPRMRTLETPSLRPFHLDARPLRSLSSQVASSPDAVGSIDPRIARSSSIHPSGRSSDGPAIYPNISGNNVSTNEEPNAFPSSVTLLRRAPTPALPMATTSTGDELLFNLGNTAATSSTHYDPSELLTSTVTPWREFSAFRSSVHSAREAVEPLTMIGRPANTFDSFSAGLAGHNETGTSTTDTSRLSDTQRVLRGAQQALRTAVAFAQRLEQVTQSISSADQHGYIGGPELPTTRTDRWTPARLSDGAPTTTTNLRSSSIMAPPAMLSLQRSIVQLRAASLRIDILLQEFPDFVRAAAHDEASPSPSDAFNVGAEVSPEEHRARFYHHYNTSPSTSSTSVSSLAPTGDTRTLASSSSDNIDSRLELARSRLRHAQMTLDSMSRIRDQQDRYVQQQMQPGSLSGDVPTLMPASASQEFPSWEEARRARPEWQFVPTTSTLAQEQNPPRTATEIEAITPGPAPAPTSAPAPMNPSLLARWRMSSQRSPLTRGTQASNTGRATRRAFPIKLDRNGVEIQDESGDEQSDQEDDVGPRQFIGGLFGGREERRPSLRRKWSRELCGR
ncbi:BZ3500_MvSof-1268-A1-R1_Chr5-2g08088 [Microbotryum saponariae]|uniref:BZ3500_MvSof-1268-A1-R1_Chr5-2g08088 protein n=1 Tax=Microbotryum saponariae TaxID=289078 RepID=A0A2X0NKG6_9BASI|nr:BZ3500_MvSof-1268-A1-R1_Chr5-2g08088 [Microbotryum saponariae]SDA05957.1 BZ3501_MvSof-1269-A2-R1_Chr5-2g07910 [Microbotryum saponariae]